MRHPYHAIYRFQSHTFAETLQIQHVLTDQHANEVGKKSSGKLTKCFSGLLMSLKNKQIEQGTHPESQSLS